MEHARRRCGRSCLGPGFESPRLHFLALSYELTASNRAPFFVFREGKSVQSHSRTSIESPLERADLVYLRREE